MTSRPSGLRLIGVTLVLLGQLNACTSWRVQSVTPGQLFARGTPKEVRVQRPDATRMVLKRPQLVGDSLFGRTDGKTAAVYVRDVSEIAVRRPNALKTVGLIVGIVAIPVALIGLKCLLQDGCDTSSPGLY